MSMAKELELEAVRCAESGNLQRALELLTEAQKVSSEYASVYNNRAQVSCIRGKHVRFDTKHCYFANSQPAKSIVLRNCFYNVCVQVGYDLSVYILKRNGTKIFLYEQNRKMLHFSDTY